MPTITSIKPQRNQKRVNIYLDGKFGFGIDLENLVTLRLRVEQELTEEERQFCLNRFASGETWAGIYRTPETPPVPGFTPHRGYDTHGNSRGQGNDGLNRQWCH